MKNQSFQTNRSELKYLIEESRAREIRDFASNRMKPDHHTLDHWRSSYPVHSIYLDSPDRKIYWNTIRKTEKRFKLRMRFYKDTPGSPVFLEVKRHVFGRTQKSRVKVNRTLARCILDGDLLEQTAEDSVLDFFSESVRQIGARPVLHISYDREALVGFRGESCRLTMDRSVRFQSPECPLSTGMQNPTLAWPGLVVLELKFTGRMPSHFKELITHFALKQSAASKYVRSLQLQEPELDQEAHTGRTGLLGTTVDTTDFRISATGMKED